MRGHSRHTLVILLLCLFVGLALILSQTQKPRYVLSLEPLPGMAASATPAPLGWVVYEERDFNKVPHPKKPLLAVTSLNSPLLLRWVGRLPRGSRLEYAQPGWVIPNYEDREVGTFVRFCRRRGVQVVFLPVV